MSKRISFPSIIVPAIIAMLLSGGDLLNITTGPEYNIEIRTDKEVYTLPTPAAGSSGMASAGDSNRVSYSATNLSAVPVYYLAPWHYVTLEKKVNGTWINLGPWYGYIAIGPYINAFEPGDTLQPIELSLTNEIFDGPGYYRFIFDFYTDREIESLLPSAHRVSNIFEVREP